MDPNFRFDYESSSSDDEPITKSSGRIRSNQTPWKSSSTQSAEEEYKMKNTTSIDEKISKIRKNRLVADDEYSDEEEEDVHKDEEGIEEVKEEKEEGCEEEEEVEEVAQEEDEDEDEEEETDIAKSAKKEHDHSKTSNDTSGKEGDSFFGSSDGASFHANSFRELNLSRPLLRACEALEYHKPTPIQAACIPLALLGRDICGSALTGSGKTAAFVLPVLERLLHRQKSLTPAIRVLILAPTRELATQVHSMIQTLAQFTNIRCCLIVGGESVRAQEAELRSQPDIVVATPGRIIDHLHNSISVGLEDLNILILDEADRLLQDGFSGEIQELIRLSPKRRQTMLFSATMTEEVNKLVKLSLDKPVRLQADPSSKRPSTLTEEIVRIRRTREAHQEAVLLALCSKAFTKNVIIFSGQKKTAHRLKIIFGLTGKKAAELHGDLTQSQRIDALEQFKRQEVDFLITTDVAARGLDIYGVQTVINYACPRDIATYVHRVGRTARAGREGYAVTFVTDNDLSLMKSIAKKAGSYMKIRHVAEQPIAEWSNRIEQLEDQISQVLEEESEEKILRKAEMEATKAENLIKHKDEIYSRPQRYYPISEREKRLIAKNAKASLDENKTATKQVMSVQQSEEKRLKEKRKKEHEKNLPRKKRRRLEAARQMLEDDDEHTEERTAKSGKSLVEVGYARAKSVKTAMRARESGKTLKKSSKQGKKSLGRKEEMMELFQSDMSEKKLPRSKNSDAFGRKKAKSSFKSKSRYKRRK